MTQPVLPGQNEAWSNDDGRINPVWWHYLDQLGRYLEETSERIDQLIEDLGGIEGDVSTLSFTDGISGLIPFPEDTDYVLRLKSPHAGTIKEVVTRCTAGTATAELLVDGASIDGSTNAVSTSEDAQDHETEFSLGSEWVLRVSSTTDCENLSFSIKYSRPLQG